MKRSKLFPQMIHLGGISNAEYLEVREMGVLNWVLSLKRLIFWIESCDI